MHYSWHLLAITITIIHLHLIITIITPPIQTLLLDLGPYRVPSLWPKVTQITVNFSISHPPQSTINQLLHSHPPQAPKSAKPPRTHWVHHLLNNLGLEKRIPLQILLPVQGHLHALLFLVVVFQAGLSIAIMSSILLCIKHHVLNVRLRPSSATDPTWAKCRVPCQNCELGCELGSWHFPRQRTKHSESAWQPFPSFVPFLASSSCSLL